MFRLGSGGNMTEPVDEVIGFTILFTRREPHIHLFKTPKPVGIGDTFHLDYKMEVT
jgi:hypothetical protein